MTQKRAAGLLFALSIACCDGAAADRLHSIAVSGGRLTVTQRGASTVLTYAAQGQMRRAVLPTEAGIYADALESVRLLGTVAGRVLILSTTYASRPGGPTPLCGAGGGDDHPCRRPTPRVAPTVYGPGR